MSRQSDCQTYMACPNEAGDQGEMIILRLPCVSTENVDVTQNKTQLPACRGDSQQTENVDSTSYSATGQIELKDGISELFARLLYKKACECVPACFIFLSPKVGFSGTGNLYGAPLDLVSGIVICGVPDATWTRDQSGKSLSFTVTPSNNAFVSAISGRAFTGGKYSDWLAFAAENQFDVGGPSCPSDDIDSLTSIQLQNQLAKAGFIETQLD